MEIAQQLAMLAVEQLVPGMLETVGGKGGEVVGRFLQRHFISHGERLQRALQSSQQQAWQALEIALAGAGWWQRCQNALASADQQALRQQIRQFLDAAPLAGLTGFDEAARLRCLTQIRAARKAGLLEGTVQVGALATALTQLSQSANATHQLTDQWQQLDGLAATVEQQGYPDLARFLRLRPSNDGPGLLTTVVRAFFLRQVENDEPLFQGLAWSKLEQLATEQTTGFLTLSAELTAHGQQLESLLAEVSTVVVETRDHVLDIKTELQGQREQIQQIGQAVLQLLEAKQLQQRPLRPSDSLSIRGDAERQVVSQVLERYRKLPAPQRQELPALLEAVGKLEVAAGEFHQAQQDFQTLAGLVAHSSLQAEAHFHAYRAALERREWTAALKELIEAVKRDARRFAPFPMGKYQPVRILGAGGFGVAFLCKHRNSGSQLVIKSLLSEDLDRDIADLFREAQALDLLQHPGIIRFRDCDYTDKENRTRPYLVMDYFEGITLEQYIEQHGPLTETHVITVAGAVARALQAAHSKGVLHRDIKPANLLVRRSGKTWDVRLIDFGLALRSARVPGRSGPSQTLLGASIAGTLDYGAPEQMGRLTGVKVGPQTDIYAFAKTFCFALFQTTQPLMKHWNAVDPALAQLLEDCLNEQPSERPASFKVILKRLEQFEVVNPELIPEKQTRASAEVTACEPAAAPRSSPRLLLLAGGGGLVALTLLSLLIAFGMQRGSGSDAPTLDPPPEDTGRVAFVPPAERTKTLVPITPVTLMPDSPTPVWRADVDPPKQKLHVLTTVMPLTVPRMSGPVDEMIFASPPTPFIALGANTTSTSVRQIVDLRTGKTVAELKSRNKDLAGKFGHTALSADGNQIAFGASPASVVEVWSTAEARLLARWSVDAGSTADTKTSGRPVFEFGLPRQLATVKNTASGLILQTWDIDSQQLVLSAYGFQGDEMDAVAFSPGRRYVALATGRHLWLIDMKDRQSVGWLPLPEPKMGESHTGLTLAFSPNGSELSGLFAAGPNWEVITWDVARGQMVHQHVCPAATPPSYSRINQHKHAMQWLGARGGWLLWEKYIVDYQTGELTALDLPVELLKPRQALVPGSDTVLVVSGEEGRRVLTSVPLKRQRVDLVSKPPPEPLGPAQPSTITRQKKLQLADWSRLKTVDATPRAVEWKHEPTAPAQPKDPLPASLQLNSTGGQVLAMLFTHQEQPQAALLCRKDGDKPRLLSWHRYEMTTGKHLGTVEDLVEWPSSDVTIPLADLSPEGTKLTICDPRDQRRLDLWDGTTNNASVAWSPYEKEKGDAALVKWFTMLDNQTLVTANAHGQLIQWKIEKGVDASQSMQVFAALKAESTGRGLPALSPTRATLALFTGDTYDLFDTHTLERRGQLAKPGGTITSVGRARFSPDGTRFAALLYPSAAPDTEPLLVWWDLKSGKVIEQMRVPQATATLDWCGAKHLLLNQESLLDLDRKAIVWRYRFQGTNHLVSDSPDSRFWYVRSNTPRGPATLQAVNLVDDTVTKRVQAVLARTLVVKPGMKIGHGTLLDGVNFLLGGKELVPTLDNELANRLKSMGFTPVLAAQQPLLLKVVISDRSAISDRMEVAYRPTIGAVTTRTVRIKKYVCQVAYVDQRTGAVYWQMTNEFTTPRLNKEFTGAEDPQKTLDALLWEQLKRWVYHDLPIPTHIGRTGTDTLTLPGETVLGN